MHLTAHMCQQLKISQKLWRRVCVITACCERFSRYLSNAVFGPNASSRVGHDKTYSSFLKSPLSVPSWEWYQMFFVERNNATVYCIVWETDRTWKCNNSINRAEKCMEKKKPILQLFGRSFDTSLLATGTSIPKAQVVQLFVQIADMRLTIRRKQYRFTV